MYQLDFLIGHDTEKRSYSDEQYLAFQIWQLGNIFQDTLMAIKDANLNFVAITNSYAKEFEFHLTLDAASQLSLNNEKLSTLDVCSQERNILKNHEVQDSIFLYKATNSKSLSAYLMRKRPIMNPSTNDEVGILIAAKKQEIGEFRSIFLNQLLGMNKKMKFPDLDSDLTDHQYQIILCLLYGYHSRKEITTILAKNTGGTVNETRIKNQLSNLYDKFQCNSPAQLIQQINQNSIKLEVPIDSAEEGNYPI